MIGCVHTAGSNDPCPDPRPQQERGNLGLSSSKPVPATNGKSKATMHEGATSVNGRLPPEVILRIVRQNFGRFRLCYENALKKKPKLSGRVATKFVIDRDGSVKMSQDNGSDLPDAQAVACIVASFGQISFPQPEGGIVTVVYPLVFSVD
jgi:outer membrane biosynthesis protein TonB